MVFTLEREAIRAFRELCELATRERQAAIDRVCGGNQAVKNRVVGLLQQDEMETSYTESLRQGWRSEIGVLGDPPLTPPVEIGRYRLLDVLGHGGMATVYRAEQAAPRREVAVKVMRLAIESPASRARFEYEGEIVGSLQHSGIAQLYEVGSWQDGETTRLFLAMEWIRGESLERWVERRDPTVAERLRLLIDVCSAVHFAHQKRVVHRDLKPQNIVVNEDGLAKILDFGIARVVDDPLWNADAKGAITEGLGTPRYMSPEQFLGSPNDIDARSDVYSLGVIAFELLVGHPPFVDRFDSFDDMHEQVSSRDPSQVLSSSVLPRELRAVLITALATDVDRRYASADALRQDLERCVGGYPVSVIESEFWYPLRKLVGRYRLASAALVALLLVTVSSLTWVSGRDRAAANRIAVERDASVGAFGFVEQMLLSVDPTMGARDVRLIDAVDTATSRVADLLPDNPLLQGTILAVLGRVYLHLGEYEVADPLLARAIGQASAAGDAGTFVGASLSRGWLKHRRGDSEGAESLFLGARREARAKLGESHVVTRTVERDYGGYLIDLRRFDEAEAVLLDALGAHERAGGDDFEWISTARQSLAMIASLRGDGQAAEAEGKEQYEEAQRRFGEDHWFTRSALNNWIAVAMTGPNRMHLVEPAKRLYEKRVEILGVDHADTVSARGNFANLLALTGDFDRSIELIRENTELLQAKYGSDHPRSISNANNYAHALLWQQRVNEAVALFRTVLDASRLRYGDESSEAYLAESALGQALCDLHRYAEAEALFRTGFEGLRRHHGDRHLDVLRAEQLLGTSLFMLGRLDEAEPIVQSAADKLTEVAGLGSSETLVALGHLAMIFRETGRPEEAVEIFDDLVSRYTPMMGMDNPRTLRIRNHRAQALLASGRLEEARDEYVDLRRSWESAGLSGSVDFFNTVSGLGTCLVQLKRYNDAEELLLPLIEEDGEAPQSVRLRVSLAELYVATGRDQEGLHMAEVAFLQQRDIADKQSPKTLKAAALYASILVKTKDPAKAIRLLDELLADVPAPNETSHDGVVLAYLEYANALAALGETERASEIRAVLEQIGRMPPKH